jgi:hypothetical protein
MLQSAFASINPFPVIIPILSETLLSICASYAKPSAKRMSAVSANGTDLRL